MSGHDANKMANARKAFLISKQESDALLVALRHVEEDALEEFERAVLFTIQRDLVDRWGEVGEPRVPRSERP